MSPPTRRTAPVGGAARHLQVIKDDDSTQSTAPLAFDRDHLEMAIGRAHNLHVVLAAVERGEWSLTHELHVALAALAERVVVDLQHVPA